MAMIASTHRSARVQVPNLGGMLSRVFALMAVSVVALAQPSTPWRSQDQGPSFPVTTRLVQVSVVVHKDGAPVPGLAAEDFQLFEDGKEQPIESFSVESDRATPGFREPPPGVFTNQVEGQAGGVSVILLDRLNTRWEDQGQARDQIVKFLSQIQRGDRVALYLLDSSVVRILHDFTRDTGSLLRALARYRGATSKELAASEEQVPETDDAELNLFLSETQRMVTAMALQRRAESTSLALEAIANHLAGVRGRKNLIWVSSGFPFVFDDPAGRGSPAGLSQRSFASEVNRATRAVNNADIAIYPVDARGLLGAFVSAPAAQAPTPNSGRTMRGLFTTLETTMAPVDTMKTIAENTGGRVFYNTNDIGGAIRRAVDDSRLTYVLGYSPSHGRWDGRFHEIKVKVKRPGTDVRHRRGYLALPLPQQDKARTERGLRDALSSPLEATGIALTATLQRIEAQDRREVNVAIQVEPRSVTLAKKGDVWEGSFALVIAQSAAEGKLFKSVDSNVELRLSSELRERMLKQGLVLNKKVALRDDAHRLHVLVRDLPTGAMGSLIIPADKLRGAVQR